MTLLAGTIVEERFEVVGPLGQGGMAEVLLVRHRQLGSRHALKVLFSSSSRMSARLMEEGRIQATLLHPNLVRVTDIVSVRGQVGLIMDYVSGPSLSELLRGQAPELTQALALGRGILAGVAHAHRAGLVHRDLKPANILLEREGRGYLPRVADFGVAKMGQAARAADATGAGQVLGSLGFMAPEQYRGSTTVDQRSDVFALGAVLYELLTGSRAFPGRDLNALTHAAATGRYEPLRSFRPELDEQIEAVVVRCLQPSPERRYASAIQLEQAWDQATRLALGRQPTQPLLAPTVDETPSQALDPTVELHAPVGVLVESPPPKKAHLHGVPAEVDLFVGRRRVLAELHGRVTRGARLVTVVDAGGIGKTRLATRYANAFANEHPGGVMFCDLTEARVASDVRMELARRLGLRVVGDEIDDVLCNALLHRGPCLVVLDNFEQIVDLADETVGRWLAATTHAVFLVTSRMALRIDGEELVLPGPLSLPEAGTLAAVRASEAGQLFLARARAVQPKLTLSEAMATDVAAVVTELDGLPLAIELAASRLRVLSPSQLRRRLVDRFAVLRTSRGRKPARTATLRGAIDWSWSLLTAWERSTLATCSIFAGGFSLEVAEAVVDLRSWPQAPPVIDVIESLVDQSLLRSHTHGDVTRFSLYVSIRAYAAEVLLTEPAVDDTTPISGAAVQAAAVARQVAWYSNLYDLEALPDLFWIHGGDAAYDRADADREDIVTSFQAAVVLGEVDAAGRLAVLFTSLALIGGPMDQAMRLMNRALAMQPSGRLRWRLLWLVAAIAPALGQIEAGQRAADEALDLAKELGCVELEARTLREWGTCYAATGKVEQARQAFTRAIELLAPGQTRFVEGLTAYNLASDALARGDLDAVAQWAEHQRRCAQQAGIAVLEVSGCAFLAAVHRQRGQVEQAWGYVAQSLAAGRSCRNRQWEIEAMPEAARVARAQGRWSDARAFLDRGLDAARSMGDSRDEVDILGDMAAVELARGRDDEARRIGQTLASLSEICGDHSAGSRASMVASELAARAGRDDDALRRSGEGVASARRSGRPESLARALAGHGRAAMSMGQLSSARESLREGLDLAVDPASKALLLVERARLSMQELDSKAARDESERARKAAVAAGNPHLAAVAQLVAADAHISEGDIDGARVLLEVAREELSRSESLPPTLDGQIRALVERCLEGLSNPRAGR